MFLGRSLNTTLDRAEQRRDGFGDSYIAIEHLLLALAEDDRCGRQLLSQAGVTTNTLKEAITAVRGNQTVTDQNPEATYESLEKYGRDLTAAARDGQLDPVIGRDEEIRRTIQILSRRTKNNPVLILASYCESDHRPHESSTDHADSLWGRNAEPQILTPVPVSQVGLHFPREQHLQ